MADIRGDLIFDGFEPRPSPPHCHDEHDLALPPDSAQSAAQVSALTLSSEPTTLVGDGRLDAAPGAAISMAIERDTGLVLCEACDSKVPDSFPDSESSTPLTIEPNWAPIMEFTAADIFQHSSFGDILNSLKSARLGCGRRRNSKPTHHPPRSHCR